MTIILGIDPGSRITGFGFIKQTGSQCTYISSGRICTNTADLSERLQKIYQGIDQVIAQYKPETVGIEQVFMARNADSALKLGQARGVAIVAAKNHNLPISEYSARQVKKAVVGHGAAEKSQVQAMVTRLLSLTEEPSADAADALAIAFCHAHTRTSLQGFIGLRGSVRRRWY